MNEVQICGQVKRKPWRYDGNLYLRISIKRTPEQPSRSASEGGNFDYVTIMIPDGVALGVQINKDQQIRVRGWIQSRDVSESLDDFLKRANAQNAHAQQRTENAQAAHVRDCACTPCTNNAHSLRVHRSITEIVADSWSIIDS